LHRQPGLTVQEQILNVPEVDREIFLKSHCISAPAYEALVNDDASNFVKFRIEYIRQEEALFFGQFGITPPHQEAIGLAEPDTDN